MTSSNDIAEPKRYWFPAKRYGWGWGLPITWQGWAVLLAFVVVLALGALLVLPRHGELAFVLFATLPCAALLAVCWVKGEPPRWRWGDD